MSPRPEPVDRAIVALYDELRAVAARQLRRERVGHTLQPTALVHEAYVRLAGQEGLAWENRLHFLHIAGAQIRRILVDHARRRGRVKRGGDLVRVTLTDSIQGGDRSFDIIDLNEALERLGDVSSEDKDVVELKYFAGLTEVEIGVTLGLSERTVRRRLLFARSWLFRELGEAAEGPAA